MGFFQFLSYCPFAFFPFQQGTNQDLHIAFIVYIFFGLEFFKQGFNYFRWILFTGEELFTFQGVMFSIGNIFQQLLAGVIFYQGKQFFALFLANFTGKRDGEKRKEDSIGKNPPHFIVYNY